MSGHPSFSVCVRGTESSQLVCPVRELRLLPPPPFFPEGEDQYVCMYVCVFALNGQRIMPTSREYNLNISQDDFDPYNGRICVCFLVCVCGQS